MKIWFRTSAGQGDGRRNELDGAQSPPDRSAGPVCPTSPRCPVSTRRSPRENAGEGLSLRRGAACCARSSVADARHSLADRHSIPAAHALPCLQLPPQQSASEIPHFVDVSNRNWLANRSHTKQTIKPLLTGARIAHSDCDPLAKWRPAVQALTCLILQQFFALAAAIPVHAQDSVPVLDTTVCELTAHPGQLDGKTVRVKVQFSHGNAIKDADSQCPDTIRLAYRDKVPASSSSPNPSTSTRDIPRPTVTVDDQFELLNKYRNVRMHPTSEGAPCKPCNRYGEITGTLIGMVNFPERGRYVSDGPPPNERLFFVRSVTDVKARDLADTYDPKLYSTEPVTYPTAHLSGKLLGPHGNPLPQTMVDISSAGPPKFAIPQKTDDQGQFTFSVPPGSYVLAINSLFGPSSDLPYDVTYYPATTDIASAKVFQLSADQHVDDVIFSLAAAEPLARRKFSGKVVWPDGRVAPDAFVWLTESERDGIAFPDASTTTDANGNFSFNGFEGKDYLVHAKTTVDHEPATAIGYKLVCAQKIGVNSTAPSDAMNLTLTVEGRIPCVQQ